MDPVVLLMLLLSLGGNVYFGLRAIQPSSGPPRSTSLKLGAAMPAFQAVDLTGRSKRIDPRREVGYTVYYIFTPSCVWCERNLPNIQAVAQQAAQRFSVIGVSLEPDIVDYLSSHPFSFPVLVNPSPETVATYELGATPQTIVVSPEGKLVRSWRGAYVGDVAEEVSTFLDVDLPGVASVSSVSKEEASR